MAKQRSQLLPPLPLRVSGIFERMEIAEREIKRAKLGRDEVTSQRIHDAFPLLRPTPILSSVCSEAYAAHCLELLQRVALLKDTRPATEAEMLAAMLEAATAAPLTSEGLAVTDYLFRRVMPRSYDALRLEPVRESWAGQIEEELVVMRKKLAQDWR